MAVKNIKKYILFIPALLIAVITVYPLIWTLCGSVSTVPQLGRISIIPVGFTFDHYIEIFAKESFFRYILNTLYYGVVVMVLQLLINSLAAYPLARLRFPGKKIIFYFFLSTMMIPFSVIMVPLFIIIKGLGLVNSLTALIVPYLASGFGIFLLRQFYLGIPCDLEDAGKIDGLSYFGIYRHVILPLTKPVMLSLGLFSFLFCWNNYLWPLIVNIEQKYWVITVGIASFRDSRNNDWNAILTGSAVSMMPTAILFIFFQRQLVEGIKMTGLKM